MTESQRSCVVTRVTPKCDTFDVYIGRECARGNYILPASIWANPFTVRNFGSNEQAVSQYARYLAAQPILVARISDDLGGKRLGCWCKAPPDRPDESNKLCHGDVLAALANVTSKDAQLKLLHEIAACPPGRLEGFLKSKNPAPSSHKQADIRRFVTMKT